MTVPSQKALRRFLGSLLTLLCAGLPLQVLAGELHIQGRLVDENGNPVSNTALAAVCVGSVPEGPKIDCSFPTLVGRRGQTDPSGWFRLEKLPPAIYTLFAAIEGTKDKNAEASLRVELRASVDGLELRMEPLRSISGVVVNTDGEPVPNTQVDATLDKGSRPSDASSEHTRGAAYTDKSGLFEIKNLARGAYWLRVDKSGFGIVNLTEPVRPGGPPIRLVLAPCTAATGQVVGLDGKPVTRLEVNRRLRSEPDGHFTESYCGLDVGEVKLELIASGMARRWLTVTLQKGKVLNLGAIQLEAARPLRIQVIEKGSGKPVPHASLEFDEPVPRHGYSTGDDGRTLIDDHADLALDMSVKASQEIPQKVHISKGQREVKVVMDPGLRLSGKALDSDGNPRVGQLSAICAGVQGREGGGGSLVLGPEGEFSTRGIGGGVCTITLQTAGMPTFENVTRHWMEPQQDHQVELRAPSGPTHPIHIRFRGAQKPHKAALLMGDVPSQFDVGTFAAQLSLPYPSIQTEATGYRVSEREEEGFRFKNVHPGAYTLVVRVGKAAFRAPLTVGAAEETLTVDIPAELVPSPY